MSEIDKDIPVKEQEDGSILAKIGVDENEQFEEENKTAAAEAKDDEEDGDEAEGMAEGGEVDAADGEDEGDEEDEREKIREARREERKLKKELAKQREASAKHKITALERRNEELARRLAAVENTAASYQFAQLDKVVEDEATRVEYAKMKLLQATQAGDAEGQVEYLDQLAEAKQRLAQAQHYKKQQLEVAKAPKQNVPNPVSNEVQQNATSWLKKNGWFDPQARDTDSRIAKVVDQELASEGWDPADPEYWDELDSRLSNRLPHRYTAKGGQKRVTPTASGRSPAVAGNKPGTITLSRERVQAIKEAGAWDDVAKRNKMIRAYAQYDRENKG
jgi:hypothetical protein